MTPAPPTMLDTDSMQRMLSDLELRVRQLESRVEHLQDTPALEERITARLSSALPHLTAAAATVVGPPVDPAQPPSIADIKLPVPSASTLKGVVRTSWLSFEVFGEIRDMFLMMVDGRYHQAWLTRTLVIILLVAILFSNLWVPFASLTWFNLGSWIDKLADLFLALIAFSFMHTEARRYRAWRQGG